MCVSPVFSFTLFTVLHDAYLTDGRAMCVFLIKPTKQFSSYLLSSGYLFSSAIDASAPDDLRGVADCLLFITLFDDLNLNFKLKHHYPSWDTSAYIPRGTPAHRLHHIKCCIMIVIMKLYSNMCARVYGRAYVRICVRMCGRVCVRVCGRTRTQARTHPPSLPPSSLPPSLLPPPFFPPFFPPSLLPQNRGDAGIVSVA